MTKHKPKTRNRKPRPKYEAVTIASNTVAVDSFAVYLPRNQHILNHDERRDVMER